MTRPLDKVLSPEELEAVDAVLGDGGMLLKFDTAKRLIATVRAAWAELQKERLDHLSTLGQIQERAEYEAGRAAEREECAKLAESIAKEHELEWKELCKVAGSEDDADAYMECASAETAFNLARAIRERGADGS